MYGLVYSYFTDFIKKESFTSAPTSTTSAEVVAALLGVLLLIVVQLFVVQWLWNTILVRVVSVVKPLPSLTYTLGLLLLVAMLSPGL
jgi:hypothetical protein